MLILNELPPETWCVARQSESWTAAGEVRRLDVRRRAWQEVSGVSGGNTHGEALTRAKGSTNMRRGSRGGAYVFPRKKSPDHGEFQGHWPGHRAETGGKRSARGGSLLSQPGGSGGNIRKNPQTGFGRIPGAGRRFPIGGGAPDLRASPLGIRVARYFRQQRANRSTDLL